MLDVYLFQAVTSFVYSSSTWQALAIICASILIWVLIIWYFWGVFRYKSNRPTDIFALVLGGSMVYLFNLFLTFWYWRPRPFLVLDISPLIQVSAASKSFPSDHAALAFFIAYLLSRHNKKWHWAYILALLVAIGRVAVGVHYPLDILGGAVVGLSFGYLTIEVEKLFKQTKT